jgi:uncharacterized membrane protein
MKKIITNIVVFILIVLLIIAALFLVKSITEKSRSQKEKLFFSEKPEHWVYDNPSTIDEDVKIDVFMATEGKTRL